MVERELDRYLPFLSTTKVLMAAVRHGVGREQAHEAIKESAVAAALRLREQGAEGNDLLERLAADPRLGLAPDELAGVLADPLDFVGTAPRQVAAFVATVEALVGADPVAAGLPPGRHPLTTADPSGVGRRGRRRRPVTTDGLPHIYSGKVRDIYDAGDGRLLMVTSDRLSAFDVVMAEPIPDKGRVLTAMSAFWFEQFDGVVGSHLLSTRLADLPEAAQRPEWEGRVMLCKKAEMLPIECIVRGYITGSAWKEYSRNGTMHGEALPGGLLESAQAPRAGVHPVDQGRRRATTRTSRSRRRRH